MPFLPHVNGEDIEKLSENGIRDWMHEKLKPSGFPYVSVKAYATTIRLFYSELFRRTVKLDFEQQLRKSGKLPVVLSKSEVSTLLEGPNSYLPKNSHHYHSSITTSLIGICNDYLYWYILRMKSIILNRNKYEYKI